MRNGREWQLLSVEYLHKDRDLIQDSRELFLEHIRNSK